MSEALVLHVQEGESLAPLADLARLANESHRKAEGAAVSALEYARDAGEHLARAKAQCQHGEWLPWLEANFEASRVTAANYMRLAANWDSPNVQRVLHLGGGLRAALAELAEPRVAVAAPDHRQEIMERVKRLSEETGKPITPGFLERAAAVLHEAELTGHVDIGDGTSTPLEAALTVEAFEQMQRQKEHIRSHYEQHDGQGRRLPGARPVLPARMYCKYCYKNRDVEWHPDGSIVVCVACDSGLATYEMVARGEYPPEQTDNDEDDGWDSPPSRPHLNTLSAEDVEWYTPPEYVEAARAVMGDIDLDPASNATAQGIIRAAHHYTEETDGLAHAWRGRVWLNPPWGRICAEFVTKAVRHYEAGDVEQVILLLNSNSNETGWFQPLWDHTLCFSRGRIDYYTPDGKASSGSTHGSVFVYLGPNWREFAIAFAPFGNVVRRVEP